MYLHKLLILIQLDSFVIRFLKGFSIIKKVIEKTNFHKRNSFQVSNLLTTFIG